MLGGKHIASIITLIVGILTLPMLEDILKITLIIGVLLITVVMNLLFFWGKMQDKFLDELYSKFLLHLYKSDDYVKYLFEKQRKNRKHETKS